MIFVPDNKFWKKFVEKPISYDCMFRYNGLRPIEQALKSELQETITQKPNESDEEIFRTGINELTSARYKGFISDAARNIAYLTAIDGAVIG